MALTVPWRRAASSLNQCAKLQVKISLSFDRLTGKPTRPIHLRHYHLIFLELCRRGEGQQICESGGWVGFGDGCSGPDWKLAELVPYPWCQMAFGSENKPSTTALRFLLNELLKVAGSVKNRVKDPFSRRFSRTVDQYQEPKPAFTPFRIHDNLCPWRHIFPWGDCMILRTSRDLEPCSDKTRFLQIRGRRMEERCGIIINDMIKIHTAVV